MEHCRREFGEDRNFERCGKPAKYIVWGKLFDKDQLGPRCDECLLDQFPHTITSHIDQAAIYVIPDLSERLKEVERQREEAVEASKEMARSASDSADLAVRACDRADEAEAALAGRDRQVREHVLACLREERRNAECIPTNPQRREAAERATSAVAAAFDAITQPSSKPSQRDREDGEAKLRQAIKDGCEAVSKGDDPKAIAADRRSLTQPEADPEVPRCGGRDRVSTYRWIPQSLFNDKTAHLMGCESCAGVWAEPDRVGELDSAVIACPFCQSRKTNPLYTSLESNNRHWQSKPFDCQPTPERALVEVLEERLRCNNLEWEGAPLEETEVQRLAGEFANHGLHLLRSTQQPVSESPGDSGEGDRLVAVLHAINHSDKVLGAALKRFEQVDETESTRHALAHALDAAVFAARTEQVEGAPTEGDVVELVARWLFEHYADGELRAYGWGAISVKDHYRDAARDLLANLTPLLALEVKERLEGLERFVPALLEAEDGEVETATIRTHTNGDLLRRADVLAALDRKDPDA